MFATGGVIRCNRAYVHPWRGRPNLTVLTGTTVLRVVFEGKAATGVELLRNGRTFHYRRTRRKWCCRWEQSSRPKCSCIRALADSAELKRYGIAVVQHLPGVGQNLQDHVSFGLYLGVQGADKRRATMAAGQALLEEPA